MADFTKSKAQLLDWTLLDDTATDSPSVETSALALDEELGAILNIVVAHADTNDACTSYVYISVQGKVGSNDEDWREIARLQAGGGQATTEALDAESASGGTSIKVAATTDWDTGQLERLFLKDGTLVNSELVTIVGWSDADYYIAADNLTNTHAAATDLFDGVDEIPVHIPPEYDSVKVIFSNSHDTATYNVRVDYNVITEIA